MSTEPEPSPRQLFRSLSRVMVEPRATIRGILDSLPDHFAVPLVIVATISQYLVEDDFPRLVEKLRVVSVDVAGLIVLVSLAFVTIFTVAFFYGFSFLASWIGRLIGGTGTAEQIRSALAWGSVPWVWALLYRVPARVIWGEPLIAVVHSSGDGTKLLEATAQPLFFTSPIPHVDLFVPVLVFALLEATAAIWYLILISKCVGEAHGFSAWRAFGSLALSVFIPLMAVLTVIFSVIFIVSQLGG